MNFTAQLKDDLLKSLPTTPSGRQERFLFLRALTKMRGGIDVYKKSISLTYELDTAEDVSNIAGMLKEFMGGETFLVVDGRKGDKTPKLQIKDSCANELLKEMELSHFEGERFVFADGGDILDKLGSKTAQAYFKGVLFGGGKLQFPDEDYPNYCLQIFFNDKALCERTAKTLEHINIPLKFYERRSINILQSRSSSDIADILAFAGAVDSVLQLNNIIAKREIDNEFNRQSNLYMANLKKAVDGAQKYTQAIKYLQENGALQRADEKLQRVARARLDNDDASMQEIADNLGMSKTSLSRCLNKLLEMANRK